MSAVYRFGTFELRPDQRQLLGTDGAPVALGQRAFDVLLALVERAGDLVPKDDLLERVWPGVVVEENNLQVQVSSLRKVLGATAITTTAGRGYRFTLPLARAVDDAVAAPALPRHNMPQPLTSFVGHDDDLAEYARLLGETRLLTLTGIGGCGKTRLALELAARALPSYPDGAWYVDLAPVQDAERVALSVATTLGLREEGGRPIADTIVAGVAGKRMLLVIDNCEHLLAPTAALVGRIATAAAGVSVLAASREGLAVAGERAVTVRSLSFPAADAVPDVDLLMRSEAVRLFVDRVRLALPRFALDDGNAAAVAEICRRLDGIPLAIELAAARVKMLSVDEIRARLDDRFRLLTGGSRSAVGRQQTLLAAIRWSYDHLTPAQQALLRRLSVFVGGWTLDAATAVAGDGRDEYTVLDLLARLVDQSLVFTQHVAGSATRYAMLETVRQYAQERLDEAGEGAATRDRHLATFAAYAERVAPELVRRDQADWLARLDHERENLLAAHAWCDRAEGGARLGLRLVYALLLYFRNRGLLVLQHRMAADALARPGAQARDVDRCRALLAAGEPAYFLGRYADTQAYAEASLAIAREVGDDATVTAASRLLGYASIARGDLARAREHFEASVAMARRMDDPLQLSGSLNGLAELHRVAGRPGDALPIYEEALSLHGELGDRGGCIIGYVNLAATSILLGETGRARELLSEGIALAAALGSRRAGVAQLDGVMGLAATLGHWAFAARLQGAVTSASESIAFQREPVDEAFVAPLVARTRAALSPAAYDAALAEGRALPFDDAFAEAQAWLEELEVGSGPAHALSQA